MVEDGSTYQGWRVAGETRWLNGAAFGKGEKEEYDDRRPETEGTREERRRKTIPSAVEGGTEMGTREKRYEKGDREGTAVA